MGDWIEWDEFERRARTPPKKEGFVGLGKKEGTKIKTVVTGDNLREGWSKFLDFADRVDASQRKRQKENKDRF